MSQGPGAQAHLQSNAEWSTWIQVGRSHILGFGNKMQYMFCDVILVNEKGGAKNQLNKNES